MALSDKAIKAAKSRNTDYRLADGLGLCILVKPTGGKLWRFRYRYESKQKEISLGPYPEVSLQNARSKAEAARSQVAAGVDPSEARQATKAATAARAANSFEMVAREWYAKQAKTWVLTYAPKVLSRLENLINPYLGGLPIAEVKAPDVLKVLRRIEGRGNLETVRRVKVIIGQVMRYAIATGRAETDPTPSLKGATATPKTKHFAAFTDPTEVGNLMRMIFAYQGSAVVVAALKLAPLVFVRPNELRTARWKDINFDSAQWEFNASKGGEPHIVPLPAQAIAILRDLRPDTESSEWVFPSGHRGNNRPMSDNAILAAFGAMGLPKGSMTGHGFRAMARTMLAERLEFADHLIEHQLAHKVRDPLGRAYNRTKYLDQRKAMMQRWADYLDELRDGAKVITLADHRG